MMISIDSWVEAALDTDSTELARLIAGLPRSGGQSEAASLARDSVLEQRVYALLAVANEHSAGGDPELAAALAISGIRFCEHSYALHGPGKMNTFLFGAGQFAMDAHRAYDRLGRRDEQLAVIENALEWLKARNAEERYLVDLRFARIEALFVRGRLEQAREYLEAEAAAGYGTHPLFSLLDHQIRSRLVSATERKDTRPIEEQTATGDQQNIQAAIKAMSAIAPEFSELLQQLGMQVDSQREVLSTGESIERASNEYQKLGRFMEEMAGGSGPQFRLTTTIHQALAMLAEPQQGHNPTTLDQLRQALEAVQQEAIGLELEDTVVDTLWPLYLCYKRLVRFDKALAMLRLIRAWVTERRVMIQDPLKRAGILKQYPYLYVELGARLIERNDSAELLSVIEEAKGRALADMLAIEANRQGLLVTPESPAAWLPELMARLGSHYVTYLVDDEVTYAVCVTKEGRLHSARLSIGAKLIDELRESLDPSRWGKRTAGIYAPPTPNDVPQQLSPLVGWLGELVDTGILGEGDHICYSPDDLLHLVPLHYVDFRGAPLVKFFSVSRTHSAALLYHFSQKPVSRPTHYVAVKVPRADEARGNPEKVAKLGRAPDWLENGPLPGARIENEKADLPTLALQNLKDAVVHFATHGCFPQVEPADPFRGSGLVLSKNGSLPQDEKHCGLFSPERMIEPGSPFKFDGSHVSLQACVSGLSEEGVGGDALGPEWSLLMAGARSVLSTHWNVLDESSAAFCIRFYEEWLLKGLSRAQAWRNSVLSLTDGNKVFDGDQAYHWAAFSLAGDWR